MCQIRKNAWSPLSSIWAAEKECPITGVASPSSIEIMPILSFSKAEMVSAILPGGQTVIYPNGINRAKLADELRILERFVVAWDHPASNYKCKPARYLIVAAPHHKSIFSLDHHNHISLYVCTDNMWNLPRKERSDKIRVYSFGPRASTGYGCHGGTSNDTFVLTEQEMESINKALANQETRE
ncbi:hypothetical protein BDR07DRAFT_1379036 [Suillus spraguei]|nr:hypothetical protein BDR07DRAFT_1379036 [Suillus spraguei]